MRWHEQSKWAGRKKTDAKRGLNGEHMGVLHAEGQSVEVMGKSAL